MILRTMGTPKPKSSTSQMLLAILLLPIIALLPYISPLNQITSIDMQLVWSQTTKGIYSTTWWQWLATEGISTMPPGDSDWHSVKVQVIMVVLKHCYQGFEDTNKQHLENWQIKMKSYHIENWKTKQKLREGRNQMKTSKFLTDHKNELKRIHEQCECCHKMSNELVQ